MTKAPGGGGGERLFAYAAAEEFLGRCELKIFIYT
jgi:hypothetical protein